MIPFRAVASAIVLACAGVAAAGEPVAREAAFRYGADDPSLRAEADARLEGWLLLALDAADAPPDWNPSDRGPWDIVVRRTVARVDVLAEGHGRLRVTVDPDGLPSGAAAADGVAAAVIERLRRRIEDFALRRHTARLQPAERRFVEASAHVEHLTKELRGVEETLGEPPADRAAALAARAHDLGTAIADARVEGAVVARRLEAARAAAERAAAVADLQAEAADLERSLERSDDAALRERLGALRRRIVAATVKCPSLETARERVFELEVELVGLETRMTVLDEERRAVRAARTEAAREIDRYAADERRRAAALADQEEAARLLADVRRAPSTAGFEIVRAIAPPAAPAPPAPTRK